MNRHPSGLVRRGCCTRRHFLASGVWNLSSLGLLWLLREEGYLFAEPQRPELEPKSYDLKPKPPHYRPRAQAMISLWMQGGPSHIDLLDPKPEMVKWEEFPGEIKYDDPAHASRKVFPSPWKFRPCGQSGIEVSELLPHLGQVVDHITVIRSMYTGVNNHGQSIRALQTGGIVPGRPTLGSWLVYGLGSESQSLPAFVALIDPGQLPVLGVENWSNGWLPSLYQGTVIQPREPRIPNLVPPGHLKGRPQQQALELLSRLNQRHLQQHPGELELQARMATYELAARMQLKAHEALDISKESKSTWKLYGLDDPATREFGTRCLIARRLIERGVRFVQVYTQNQFWDHHRGIRKSLPAACRKVDKPAAALVMDLKQRGLLESTVVHWGGEMGRLPVVQYDEGPDRAGRDHNTYGFSMWVAGGGFRAGMVYGATDEFGHRAVENKVSHHDYHATLLHLFGFDHTRLVFRRNGREQTLTDGKSCRVVRQLLA